MSRSRRCRGWWPGVPLAVGSLAAWSALAAPALARRGERAVYELDGAKSRLVVHLFKAGIGAKLGHEHVISAVRPKGRLTVVAGKPDTAHLEVTVDARTLNVDDSAVRRRYRLKAMSAGDRRKVQKEMHGESQLHTKVHPTIRFVSKRITKIGGESDRFRVEGSLRIRGVEKPVKLTVRGKVDKESFRARGQLRFKQSDFGYKPYGAAGGLIKVADQAVLDIDLQGRRVQRTKHA